MARIYGCIRIAMMLSVLCLEAPDSVWAQQGSEAIGEVAAVQRAASVRHHGSPAVVPLAIRQPILVADTLETGDGAKAQALFQDDTVLTVGQRSRMEISEYLHDQDQHVRRMTVTLARGSVRALVGRAFSGLGSTFVIRAGAANVIADTGYCVVWRNDQETGVVNIGTSGPVSFVAGGRVVILRPGFYAIARAGMPPGAAAPVGARSPATVRLVIAETEIGDQVDAPVSQLAEQEIEQELRACPPGSPPGGICPRKSPPTALSPATPPAVTSGAKQR